MNQSFDLINFTKIFYNENRKGNYLENRFKELIKVRGVSEAIVELNNEIKLDKIKRFNGDISEAEFNANKINRKARKEALSNSRHKEIEAILTLIEQNISNKKYNLELIKLPYNEKIFIFKNDTPEVFFLSKQLQDNLKRAFQIKHGARNEILMQLKNLLNDGFPKYLIRTDIKSFFESIPHDKLKSKIMSNLDLDPFSKKLINTVLQEYKKITQLDIGVPRGLGVSSYLAELYMCNIDLKFRLDSNVLFYGRYVDDIILVFSPKFNQGLKEYFDFVKKTIIEEGLVMNEAKTIPIDLTKSSNSSFDYLGYKFVLHGNNASLKIHLTKTKIEKYKKKIDFTIDSYNKGSKYNEKKERKLLLQRLKYLTGNTRLSNVKNEILIGSYFSNLLLDENDLSSLICLDRYLDHKINNHLVFNFAPPALNQNKFKEKLRNYKFQSGFINRTYYPFDSQALKKIIHQSW